MQTFQNNATYLPSSLTLGNVQTFVGHGQQPEVKCFRFDVFFLSISRDFQPTARRKHKPTKGAFNFPG